MRIFGAQVPDNVSAYLKLTLTKITSVNKANQIFLQKFGIVNFFSNASELSSIKKSLKSDPKRTRHADRTEYGDFQTNRTLANSVVQFLSERNVNPSVVIEPTCGKGNFIVAAIRSMPGLKTVIGIEIYKRYVWECKFNIIEFYLDHPEHKSKPKVEIIHNDVFHVDFEKMKKRFKNRDILVIGNPPWVTNAHLGKLNSTNIPKKSNLKSHSGIDAITGKGNFDIGEYIAFALLSAFHSVDGHLALLLKNSVIRNLLLEQKRRNFRISAMHQLHIDTKTEFNASVDSALFFCKFNTEPGYQCSRFELNNPSHMTGQIGWVGNKFVSNTTIYINNANLDGISPFEWRQGVKHDLSQVMELERADDFFKNGLGEEVKIEKDLVYGLLKSSDLKGPVIRSARKVTIMTQKKVGQDTSYIKQNFPLTFRYLERHRVRFTARKSTIYRNKANYSIFGVGEYSFAPYKVCISGLYKQLNFSLVLPFMDKPVMLDDTCYLIPFDNLNYAAYTLFLLNSPGVRDFLGSITFMDAKRPFTKDVLMRVDLCNAAKEFSRDQLESNIRQLNQTYNLGLTSSGWDDFILILSSLPSR